MTCAERAMTFAESLPPDKRALCWLPRVQVLLTLAQPDGALRTFQVKYCPQTRELAHNVAAFGPRPRRAP